MLRKVEELSGHRGVESGTDLTDTTELPVITAGERRRTCQGTYAKTIYVPRFDAELPIRVYQLTMPSAISYYNGEAEKIFARVI